MAYANDRPASPLASSGLIGLGVAVRSSLGPEMYRPGVGTYGCAVVGTGRAVAPRARGNVTDMLSSYQRNGLGRQTRKRRGVDGRTRALGFIVAPLVGQEVGKIIGGLIHTDSKDPIRLASNAAAYARAQSGDQGAVDYLKYRSGQFGSGTTTYRDNTQTGSAVGGWATNTAMQDAFTKYQAVTGGSSISVGNPSLAPEPSDSSFLSDVFAGFFSTPTGATVQGAAVRGAAQNAAQKVSAALPMILMVGSAALIVANIASARRR